MRNLADPRKPGHGLAALRRRYVTRARMLAMDEHFRQVLAGDVRDWNRAYPQYRFSQEIAPDLDRADARDVPARWDPWYPPRLADDLVDVYGEPTMAEMSWESIEPPPPNAKLDGPVAAWKRTIAARCDQFWPARDFPRHSSGRHAADVFVSACLVFDARTLAESADRLFRPFVLAATASPVNPDIAHMHAISAVAKSAERDVYRAALAHILKDDPERLRAIVAQAASASVDAMAGYEAAFPLSNPETWWWYLPMDVGFSANDLKSVAQRLAYHAERQSGQLLRARVCALKDDNLSVARIARALGISEDSVTRILQDDPAN